MADGEPALALPALPMGYHRLTLEVVAGVATHRATVIAAPARCWRRPTSTAASAGGG